MAPVGYGRYGGCHCLGCQAMSHRALRGFFFFWHLGPSATSLSHSLARRHATTTPESHCTWRRGSGRVVGVLLHLANTHYLCDLGHISEKSALRVGKRFWLKQTVVALSDCLFHKWMSKHLLALLCLSPVCVSCQQGLDMYF